MAAQESFSPVEPQLKPKRIELEVKENPVVDQKYRILGKLREDWCGTLYRAVNMETQELVAVQFFSPELTSSYVEDRIRFKREVAMVKLLNHPGIAKVYEHGEYQGNPYLVTELFEHWRS